jgi:hypothetical protein
LIRRQLGNSFGDFFNFHVAQYSTAETWLSGRKLLSPKKMPRTSLPGLGAATLELRYALGPAKTWAPLMLLRSK